MRSNYFNGLEEKISQNGMLKNGQFQGYLRESGYRSKSEEIVADVLEKEGISFGYEDDLYVQVDERKGREERVWNPDFNLKDLGFVVEYAGLLDDENYQKGIEEKKKIFAENGIRVAWIYPDDVWEESDDGKYRKRPDAEERILNKVYDEMRSNNTGIYRENTFKTGSLKYVGGDFKYSAV